MLKKTQIKFGRRDFENVLLGSSGYAEQLLELLGARRVDSFDYSDYEQPTYVHDMNAPIPKRHQQEYSIVLDGGSLEHVFNFPVAILNCMKMVSVGGHYLAITPANNFFGHGFYQFSPELYFSVLSPENGFETTNILVFEDTPTTDWHQAKEPRKIRERVVLQNSRPVYLGVIAKKLRHIEEFERWPQQSDYVARWAETAPPGETVGPAPGAGPSFRGEPKAADLARALARRALRAVQGRPALRRGFQQRHFERIDWAAD